MLRVQDGTGRKISGNNNQYRRIMKKFGYILLGIISCLYLITGYAAYGQTIVETHTVGTAGATGSVNHTWSAGENGYNLTQVTCYKLVSNITVKNSFILKSGVAVIDLNGFTITNGIGQTGSVFNVYSGATLYIRSTGENREEGAIVGIDGSNSSSYSKSAAIYVLGNLNFQSGTIKDFMRASAPTTNESGCAIYVDYVGNVNMTGGTIENCGFVLEKHYNNNGAFAQSNINHKGGAVCIAAGGTFNFSGGTIKNCTAFRGGAFFLGAPSSALGGEKGLNISGNARIENCTASQRGGAVFVDASMDYPNRMVMSGGTITGCKSSLAGCGIYSKGYIKMTGGTITGNLPIKGYASSGGMPDYSQYPTLDDMYPLGGGICIEGRDIDTKVENAPPLLNTKPVFEMSGGAIENNIGCSGGGIIAYYNSKIKLSDNALIKGNHAIGNEGTGNGGGIYIQNSEFNFSGGTLEGNYARRYGGGINLNAAGGTTATNVELNGDCNIINNFAGHGGGISQEAGVCNLTIKNSAVDITGNTARGIKQVNENLGAMGDYGTGGNGGGIFIEQGEFKITAGKIEDNNVGGDGGGISLRGKRVNGTIKLIIEGGSISNNNQNSPNPGNGGGIDIYAESKISSSGNVQSSVTVDASIQAGTISGNKASNGAGINIYTDNNCNATLKIGSNSSSAIPQISYNTATGDGGGITLEHGDIYIYRGNVMNNTASNGGGICLKTGSITVSGNNSFIKENTATNYGGGLYVVNTSEGNQKSVAFTGGTFTGNLAQNGGGICVEGNIHLNASGSTLKGNVATNGGGIYLLHGNVSGRTGMKYSGGLITGNTANGTPVSGTTTANSNDAGNKGVGGGVYLAQGTYLTFEMGQNSPLGLYGNTASFAADDIYANGTGTELILPNVSSMTLQDFSVPTSELYWVEDYVTGDSNYSYGTQVAPGSNEILRYRDALRNLKEIRKINFNGAESITYNNKYLCLVLGYDLYHVSIVKKGLKKGESAIFKVSYKNNDTWNSYRTVVLPCTTDAQAAADAVKAVVVLPAGTWKIEEDTVWSWKYTLADEIKDASGADASSICTTGIDINSTIFQQLKENGKGFEYIFTNVSKETSSNKLPSSDEDVVVNVLTK